MLGHGPGLQAFAREMWHAMPDFKELDLDDNGFLDIDELEVGQRELQDLGSTIPIDVR